MDTKDYFKFITDLIHTTVAAVADNDGLPVTCAIDIMDWDEGGLYFLTAKGKNFYRRLKRSGYISLTGIKGNSTMNSIAVTVRGKVKEVENKTEELFKKNPYMYEIYPSTESRKIIRTFKIYQGDGEWFDLSKKPIERRCFYFGNVEKKEEVLAVDDNCNGCGLCYNVCPQKCIDKSKIPVVIDVSHCLNCSSCCDICPTGSIVKRRIL